SGVLAPVPDFRYVGLEPVPVRELGLAGVALVVGAGITAVAALLHPHLALPSAISSIAGGLILRGAGGGPSGVRMGIVPWGVLVHTIDTPRILRWAAV